MTQIKHTLKRTGYTSETAPHDTELTLIDNTQDINESLDYIGLPKKYRKDITALLVEIIDGDYERVYLSESGNYYSIFATYRPLPYYLNTTLDRVYNKLPSYWKVESYDTN